MIVWVVVVVMGVMPIAIMLTWADRRLGSMIQDRIGPNRTVIWLPTRIAQGGAVAPALGAAGLVALLTAGYKVGIGEEPLGVDRANSAIVYSQLGIFLLWVTFAIIAGVARSRGPRSSFDLWIQQFSPRSIVYLGFGAHLAALIVHLGTAGTDLGATVVDVGYGGGAALLVFAILFGAGYTAYAIKDEPRVGLRLLGLPHAFVADGLKTAWKEDFIPPNADRFLHGLAPLISFFPALTVFAVIPFGDTLCFGTTASGNLNVSKLAHMVSREGMCTTGGFRLQVVDL